MSGSRVPSRFKLGPFSNKIRAIAALVLRVSPGKMRDINQKVTGNSKLLARTSRQGAAWAQERARRRSARRIVNQLGQSRRDAAARFRQTQFMSIDALHPR